MFNYEPRNKGGIQRLYKRCPPDERCKRLTLLDDDEGNHNVYKYRHSHWFKYFEYFISNQNCLGQRDNFAQSPTSFRSLFHSLLELLYKLILYYFRLFYLTIFS